MDRSGPPIFGRSAIDASAIRGFLGAVEDANPLYWDDDFAVRNRFGRPIAPAHITMTMAKELFWAPPEVLQREREAAERAGGDFLAKVFEVVRKHGFVHEINVERDDEFLEVYHPGDGRITEATRVTDVSVERETRLGPAVFITTAMEYRTEHTDRLVARATNVIMSYRPRDLPPDAEPDPDAPPIRAVEPPRQHVEWEAVEEGAELPQATYGPLTSATVAKAMADTHDFSRLMFDAEFARSRGVRGRVVNTMWYQGLLGRYANEWAGPEAILRRQRFRIRGSNCEGDTLIVSGRVTAKRSQDGRKLVDVDVHIDNQLDRDTVVGAMTIELP